jgi:hypothetical protein
MCLGSGLALAITMYIWCLDANSRKLIRKHEADDFVAFIR